MPHIEYVIIWLINRAFVLAQSCSHSGTIVSPTNACQATYRVLDTVLSAPLECYIVDDCSAYAAHRKYVINMAD
jgi:hypothetical protein